MPPDTSPVYEPGDVVQLTDKTRNPMFKFCFFTVTEPRPWGAMGFVQSLGENQEIGGRAYYRARHEEMEYVGRAVFMPAPSEEEEEQP